MFYHSVPHSLETGYLTELVLDQATLLSLPYRVLGLQAYVTTPSASYVNIGKLNSGPACTAMVFMD